MEEAFVMETKVALENHEQRLGALEKDIDHLSALTSSIQEMGMSVNRLAINMEHMVTEQKEQGERIKTLEQVPTDNWNSVRKTTITTIVSGVIGALVGALLLLIANGGI